MCYGKYSRLSRVVTLNDELIHDAWDIMSAGEVRLR